MRISDHLSADQQKKLHQLSGPKKKRNKKKRDNELSKRDLHDLMGVNRDTYRRVNGAMRRK